MFAETSLERFSNFYQKSSKIYEGIREKRETLNITKPSSKSAGGITVSSLFYHLRFQFIKFYT